MVQLIGKKGLQDEDFELIEHSSQNQLEDIMIIPE